MSQRTSLVIRDGFGERTWLTRAEWETYRRRVAVRYPQNLRVEVINRDGESCSICHGGGEDDQNPIQLAHRIPFKLGVVDWGLSPDWLDGAENLCLAHRKKCNDRAELQTNEIPSYLRSLGVSVEGSPAVAGGLLIVRAEPNGDVVEFRAGPTSSGKK